MQRLLEMQWTQHRETPGGPGVEMTPERTQCLRLSITYSGRTGAFAVMKRWPREHAL